MFRAQVHLRPSQCVSQQLELERHVLGAAANRLRYLVQHDRRRLRSLGQVRVKQSSQERKSLGCDRSTSLGPRLPEEIENNIDYRVKVILR